MTLSHEFSTSTLTIEPRSLNFSDNYALYTH